MFRFSYEDIKSNRTENKNNCDKPCLDQRAYDIRDVLLEKKGNAP